MLAGGLRNPRTFIAAPESEGACACRLGADPAHGLECAKWKHVGADTGQPREAVLRSKSHRVRQIERVRGQTSTAARTKVLCSEGILLG